MSQPCVLLPNRPMFNLARATIWPKAKKCPKAIRPSGTLIHGYFDCLCRQFTDTVILIIQRMGKKSKRQVIRSPKTTSLTPLRLRLNDPGNVKKCAVGKHPKSEKHGNTAQFSEVERSGTQENCGGIESGCLLRLHPLPVPRRRQPKRVACIDPDAVVVDKNIAKNDRFDLFSR